MNEKEITLYAMNIIGSTICCTSNDGERVFNKIKSCIENNCKVTLSFKGTTGVISTFLFSAIGKLYEIFSIDTINDYLSFSDHEENELIEQIIKHSIKYYSKELKSNGYS